MTTELTPTLEREMREAAKAAEPWNTDDNGWWDAECFETELIAQTEVASFLAKTTPRRQVALLSELDRLRAENAASAEVVRELRARVADKDRVSNDLAAVAQSLVLERNELRARVAELEERLGVADAEIRELDARVDGYGSS